jgi:hypothetical protein
MAQLIARRNINAADSSRSKQRHTNRRMAFYQGFPAPCVARFRMQRDSLIRDWPKPSTLQHSACKPDWHKVPPLSCKSGSNCQPNTRILYIQDDQHCTVESTTKHRPAHAEPFYRILYDSFCNITSLQSRAKQRVQLCQTASTNTRGLLGTKRASRNGVSFKVPAAKGSRKGMHDSKFTRCLPSWSSSSGITSWNMLKMFRL